MSASTSGAGRYARSLGFFYFSGRAIHDDALYREVPSSRHGDVRSRGDPSGSHFDAPNIKEALDRMLNADNATRLPDHPVMILDRMSDGPRSRGAVAVSGSPNWRSSAPACFQPRFKIRRMTRRRIIQTRAGAERYLPREILNAGQAGLLRPRSPI